MAGVAETLGAIALLDPAIKFGGKLLKAYKTQALFGNDFVHYVHTLNAERQMLNELLKTPIAALPQEYRDDLRDITDEEQLQLVKETQSDDLQTARVVLSTLADLSEQFEKCEKLLRKHVPPVEKDIERKDQANLPNGTSEPTSTEPAGEPSSSTHATLAQLQTPDAPEKANSQKLKHPGKRAPASNSGKKFDGKKPTGFRRQKFKNSLKLHFFFFKKPKAPTSVGIIASSVPHSSQPSSSTQVDVKHDEEDTLQSEDILHAREMDSELAKKLQSRTGIIKRTWEWTREDRKEFLEGLSRIHKGNELLEGLCRIRVLAHNEPHPPETADELFGDESTPTLYFRALEALLALQENSAGTSVHLRLHHDYSNYSRDLRLSIPEMALVKDAYAFPLEAESKAAQTLETTELLLNVTKSPGPTALGVETPWPEIKYKANTSHYLQHQTNLETNGFSGQLFAHLPARSAHKITLREVISGAKPDDPMAVGLRSRTAASVAGFFHGCFDANPSLSSLSLLYLLEKPISGLSARSVEPELKHLYLADMHNPQHSFFSDEERVVHQKSRSDPIHQLGLILYEIAVWKPLTTGSKDRSITEVLEEAQTHAYDVQNTPGLGRDYYKSLMKCLNWDPQVIESSASVFRREVLEPLRKLSEFYPAPTNEKW